jgi:hypothetical protein
MRSPVGLCYSVLGRAGNLPRVGAMLRSCLSLRSYLPLGDGFPCLCRISQNAYERFSAITARTPPGPDIFVVMTARWSRMSWTSFMRESA